MRMANIVVDIIEKVQTCVWNEVKAVLNTAIQVIKRTERAASTWTH